MGGASQAFDRMGGVKGAIKKIGLNTLAPLSKQNMAMNRAEYRTVMNPAPVTEEEKAASKTPGMVFSTDPDAAEEARRRRAAQRRPAATMLSSGDGQTMGG